MKSVFDFVVPFFFCKYILYLPIGGYQEWRRLCVFKSKCVRPVSHSRSQIQTNQLHHLTQHIDLPQYAMFQTPKPVLVVTTSCSNSQFCSDWLTSTYVCSDRFSHSLDTLYPCCTLICAHCNPDQRCFSSFGDWSWSLTAALQFECECFFSCRHHSKFSLTHAQQLQY